MGRVTELTSAVIRQEIFQDFFKVVLNRFFPISIWSRRATNGLPAFFNAAS